MAFSVMMKEVDGEMRGFKARPFDYTQARCLLGQRSMQRASARSLPTCLRSRRATLQSTTQRRR